MNAHSFILAGLVSMVLASSAAAQTSYLEIEPNSQKAEATLVNGITPGDTITGITTGAGTTLGDTTVTSADVFRVKTAALPLGIYRYTLSFTSTPVAGQTATIRGLNQVNGVIGTTDAAVQNGWPNVWYGFGKQEELYYRVTGISTTTGAYTATLTMSTITPTPISGTFNPGPITVASAQGQTTDAEIFIYDGNLDPVPMGHNDNPIAPLSGPNCFVTVNLAPGRYYVAISRFNTANNQSDAHPNEVFLNENVVDFPNVIVNNTTTPWYLALSYTVTDGVTLTPVAAITSALNIEWGTFTVHPITIPTSFCMGDGSGSACPCANSGSIGNGCANASFASGAHLAASGTASASVGSDTLVLAAADIPGPGLFMQGTGQAGSGAGSVFGDGLVCLGGSIVRLGVVFPTGGTATYPGGLTPGPIHIAGGTVSGDVRHYQCWYRDAVAFCTTDVFNLTQGLTVPWGP